MVKATHSLRVLHAPTEIAGQMGITVRSLRSLGVEALSCTYSANKFGYPCDTSLDLEKTRSKAGRIIKIASFTASVLKEFDIFHFHFGESLLPYHMDLPILKVLGKKMVAEFWGSDVRQKSKALSMNAWSIAKGEERAITRNLEILGRYIDVAIVADYELREYIVDFFQEVQIVPQRVMVQDFIPSYPDPNKKKPLVVHAPTHRATKGTEYVIRAIDAIEKTYEVESQLIEDKLHAEALSIYGQADIVVDQLRGGTHGLLAVEAMALGKPVITYIREDLRSKYPAGLPIVSANPETIYDQLKLLVEDGELRYNLGVQGRQYVEENHDALKVAAKLIEIYNRL